MIADFSGASVSENLRDTRIRRYRLFYIPMICRRRGRRLCGARAIRNVGRDLAAVVRSSSLGDVRDDAVEIRRIIRYRFILRACPARPNSSARADRCP